jgi:hypothetical protein
VVISGEMGLPTHVDALLSSFSHHSSTFHDSQKAKILASRYSWFVSPSTGEEKREVSKTTFFSVSPVSVYV